MEDKAFVWTSELNKKLFQLRFENDWLFKSKKQPWAEFHKLLLDNGFPGEMTVDHVRKKWSYNLDMYKIAKKTNNTSWKHYKVFEKLFGKNEILDKYESWNDDWRLKLIICVTEAKEMKLDPMTLWKTVERAMRCQDLPLDCCIQDMKGLWHHIKMIFTRKHRLKLKKGSEQCEWPLYDSMLNYYMKFEPDVLATLESQPTCGYTRVKGESRYSKLNKNKIAKSEQENENEFQWSKDITETFIQIRLQHDWLFRQKKWAWNEMVRIMIDEYGFPKTLTSRELGRKWAATFAEYQKAKATNNKTWVYHNLFELYLGDSSSLTLNPLVDWQEEWVFNLISARTDLEPTFKTFKDTRHGWREVEKMLRSIGIPLDHSLLELQEIWMHLLKTFRWKTKFANKGLLNEQWPYFEAMGRYSEIQQKNAIKKQKFQESQDTQDHYADVTNDDDYEDDMKLLDLKEKLQLQVKPKFEVDEADRCRSCSKLEACIDIFGQKDDDGLDIAHKLKLIGGIQVEKSDNLPSHICLNCLQVLENAYKFRRKCQEIDKQLRCSPKPIKVEVIEKHETQEDTKQEHESGTHDIDISFDHDDDVVDESRENDAKPKVKKEKLVKKKKRGRKSRYDYWKICEVCGKHTRNLISHLDTHATDKLYSCNVCDKKFKFKSGLIIHKAVHDPTPRKTCEVCGKTFHILAQYRRHFVYHANERKYGCETCGKRFNTLDILRVHYRTHTDERPFSCQECGKTFRTAGCVSRHKRIVHRSVKKVQ